MPAPFLLDTDHCIAYLNRHRPQHSKAANRIDATPIGDLRVSTFTALELAEGPFHSPTSLQRQAAQAAIARFFQRTPHVPITDPVIQEFGRIRAELRRQGQLIGEFDIGIAATALAFGYTLVTHNTSDFNRIAGLRLEDWFL